IMVHEVASRTSTPSSEAGAPVPGSPISCMSPAWPNIPARRRHSILTPARGAGVMPMTSWHESTPRILRLVHAHEGPDALRDMSRQRMAGVRAAPVELLNKIYLYILKLM